MRSVATTFINDENRPFKVDKTPKEVIADRIMKEKEKTRPSNYPLPVGYLSAGSTEGSFLLRDMNVKLGHQIFNDYLKVYRL